MGFLTALTRSQWSALSSYQWQVEPGWIVLALAMVELTWLYEVGVWRTILNNLSPHHLSYGRAAQAWFISNVIRYIPGNIWQFLGMAELAADDGVPRLTTLTSLVVHQVLVTANGLVLVGSYFAVAGQGELYLRLRPFLLLVPLGLLLLQPRLLERILNWLLTRVGRAPLQITLTWGQIWILLARYSGVWIGEGLGFAALVRAFVPISWSTVPYLVACWGVAYLAGYLSLITPSGLGVREGAMALMLAPVLPAPAVPVVVVAARLWMLLAELLGAAVALIARRRGAELNGESRSEMTYQAREKFLVFGSPLIEEEDIEEVVSALRSGWIGTGPRVGQFEQAFAAYKGVSQAAAVNSCTAALHLSTLAAGIKPGDEVITTAMTFCSSVNAIIHAGATPVVADVDPLTMNIDPAQVEARITPRTRAIMPVHFAGRPCDMGALTDLARRYGLKLIEDCAHAIETEWMGRKAGTFGDFGCFSFYVTKNVITGEGGMVLAARQEDIDRIKILALHGMSKDAWRRYSDSGFKHYQVVECGYKYNMMDLQAALGIHQLERVEKGWRRRRAIWECYDEAFADLPLGLPAAPEPGTRHAYHLYTVKVDEARAGISRDAFLDAMTARKIGVGVHYVSVPEHPYYQQTFGWRPEDTPQATRIGRQTVSLPLSPKLTDEDVQDVIAAVRDVLGAT